jgi:DNA-binding LacI/PurR family transcriptional regulator
VSNVLNSRNDRVSSETRERVLAAVRELRYRPTALEANQKAMLSKNLGVMVTDTTKNPIVRHGYFREVLDGILETAFFRGWSISIFAENTWDDLGLAIRRSYDGRCDGLIMIAPIAQSETVSSLQERGTPLVLVGTTPWLAGVSSVDVNNEEIGENAAQHLFDLGHRRFIFVGSDPRIGSSRERSAGFFKRLAGLGVGRDRIELIYARELSAEEPREQAVAEYIHAKGAIRPTGIFLWHDSMAVDLIPRLGALGLRVPQDLSIISVDGIPEGIANSPSLTTFQQPLHSIGRRAALMLIDRLEDDAQRPEEHVRFSIELIPRQSSAPAPHPMPDEPLSDFEVISS